MCVPSNSSGCPATIAPPALVASLGPAGIPECASCPAVWAPVCDAADKESAANGATYGSACFADCNGAKNKMAGNCKSIAGCACTLLFAPVCGADGITYGNAGCADCADVPTVSNGDCTDTGDVDEAVCDCDDVIDVVCGADGTTYANGCLANCSGTDVEAAGPCGADLEACDACEYQDQWSLVCIVSSKKTPSSKHGRGCKLANKASKLCRTKSYMNPCYADCEGGAGRKDGLYQGECQSVCDDKCAKKSMEPVCCSNGEEYPSYTEYPNKCYASCLSGVKRSETNKLCSRGSVVRYMAFPVH
eukprot:gene32787-33852_t